MSKTRIWCAVGWAALAWGCQPAAEEQTMSNLPTLKVTSASFVDGKPIPDRFSAYHENVSPALDWDGVPETTQSVFLLCDDPDAPTAEPWIHWQVANLPPEGGIHEGGPLPHGVVEGANDAEKTGWFGPRPPSGVHRYHFRVYALSSKLDLKPGFSKPEALAAMKGKVLAQGETIGLYAAPK